VAWFTHSSLNLYSLSRATSVRMIETRHLSVYLVIAASAVAVWLIEQTVAPPVYVTLAIAAAASLVVLRYSARFLHAREVFPELARIPLLKYALGR
jgi:hypothetical protein